MTRLGDWAGTVSGIIKLSAVWVLPPSRRVYRGLNGVELPREFWEKDEFGCKGGVEYGLMSTTTDIAVAIQYSSGRVPTIFEINVGQVRPRPCSSVRQKVDFLPHS